MSDNIAIQVDHVSKSFKLPHEKTTSIKGAVVNFYKRNKSYEKLQALKDVSFEIKQGEFFGIVGRNGSGKSTMLKMLAGIYLPSAGTIDVVGRLTPFIELGVGFSPELSGRENVYLNGALLGFSRKEMNKMYNSIVEFAELERFMDQKLKNYSSGMQVRLAFSIAIRANSDILLLDEVLAVGDAAFQRKCYDYFMSLKRNKRTVVLVTHDMGAVRQYCNRAIMIEKGRIVKSGKPEHVAQAYQKLFTDEFEKEISVSNTDSTKRWGSGKLMVHNTRVRASQDDITLTCEYIAQNDIPAPILGFTIYGPTGANILEGNTMRKKFKTSDMKKGQIVEITWTLPNILAAGTYDIAVACCDQAAVEFYDWLNGAGSFIVSREGSTAGLVDPPLTIQQCRVK